MRTFGSYEELARRAGARGRPQGRHLVGHRAVGLAGLGGPRAARLLRAGHRDLLLPRATSAKQNRVLASYREEFRYMTISSWNRERLAELGLAAELVPPGIDLDNFRPLDIPKRDDVVLAVGRSLPLKNLGLTVEAWQRLQPRPELWMFGVEPELGLEHGARYFERPSDERVNELFNEATVFVQTSIHEGFCLPLLEAMAAGTPVVSTDAHGNRDFCRHEENCLIADATPDAVSAALGPPARRPRAARPPGRAAGLETAPDYAWERRIDRLERFLPRACRASGRPLTEPIRNQTRIVIGRLGALGAYAGTVSASRYALRRRCASDARQRNAAKTCAAP